MTTDTTIPIVEEHLSVEKRQVATGKVRVRTETEVLEELVQLDLVHDEVEVTRVPVNQEVETAPSVRHEGDVTIIPVLEERLVVEKRLVLTEEIHVSRRVTSIPTEMPVTVRKQHAVIDRLPPGDPEEDQR
jgi:uncharacterized protein (TIGR02271 family)